LFIKEGTNKMGLLLICSIIIILVIIMGSITKTNIGLWAIFSAYILGSFVLKISPTEIINLWPTKLFLMLFAVTFFYSFATLNGSLEKLALNSVYICRSIPWALPIVLYFLGFALAGIGAGDGAIVLLLPISITIAGITGMNYFLAASSVICGVSTGGLTPISTINIFIRDLMEQAGYSQELVQTYANRALLHSLIFYTVIFMAAYIIFKGYKVKAKVIAKPSAFDGKQKITLGIIFLYICIMVLIPLLNIIFPEVAFWGFLKKNLNIAFVSFFCALLCLLFKVSDEKKSFLRVPLRAFTVLCGMSMLISVVSKTGSLDRISEFLSTNISHGFSPVLFATFSGIMSFFVSGFVVNTTFFPLVPGVAAGGINAGILFSAITVGALTTAVSPFSSMGAMAVSLIDDEEKRSPFFLGLIAWAIINIIIHGIFLFLCPSL
jgi:Na+/H+ antiporter NhaD/arsenite permease-like protein